MSSQRLNAGVVSAMQQKTSWRYQPVCDYPGPGVLEDNFNLKMHRASRIFQVIF
jgi:hypothetical protein